MDKPIYVTKPYLPPLEEFIPYLNEIWESRTLTNGGPFHQKLEQALCDYLGIEYISLFTNGTIALVTALQALGIKGEVITTPYSFVATSHSLLWNGISPKFVDIDPKTLNIDPQKIEEAITEQTSAILPVHCYGNPCDVGAIERIADKYGLKVIYDAAHAFAVRDTTRSILQCGDLSILSFHATKVFNTFEGGAIVCPDEKTKRCIDQLKNFGFVDEVTVVAPGINGKMSELNAAVGLVQLKHVDLAIAKRREIDALYRDKLSAVEGITCIENISGYSSNYAYFPVLIGPNYPINRDALYTKLKQNNIYARRYFYPLISEFPMYQGIASANRENLPVATTMANQVLCLPIFPELEETDQLRIINLIAEA